MNTSHHGVTIEYTSSKVVEVNKNNLIKNHLIAGDDKNKGSDFYKILKTQIQQKLKSKGWKTIAITSPNEGEGKTTTAINLALSMAKDHDTTVLLVDCDLKNQQIHKRLGYSSDYGIADHLIDDVPIEKLIVCPNINRLTIISGGKTIGGSAEILGSQKMGDIVNELKSRYDNRYIIYDLPSLLEGADTIAFLPLVEAVSIVLENDKTMHADCMNAVNLIDDNKILGIILNKY